MPRQAHQDDIYSKLSERSALTKEMHGGPAKAPCHRRVPIAKVEKVACSTGRLKVINNTNYGPFDSEPGTESVERLVGQSRSISIFN